MGGAMSQDEYLKWHMLQQSERNLAQLQALQQAQQNAYAAYSPYTSQRSVGVVVKTIAESDEILWLKKRVKEVCDWVCL